MHAGTPVDSIHQKPVSLDGGTDVTLGSDGQIHVGDDGGDGGLSHAGDPDIMPSDDNRATPTVDAPLETPLITQISSEIITTTPDIFTSYPTSEWGITWPETSPIPTTSPISIQRPLTASALTSPSITTTSTAPRSGLSSALSVSSAAPAPNPSSTSSRISSTAIHSLSTFSSLISSSAIRSSSAFISSAAPSSHSVSIINSIQSISSTVSNHTESYSTSGSSVQSTSSSTPVGEQNPSETIVAPPVPADFNVHNPTFYASIALGTIISIASFAAFISWWIRSRSRRKCSAQTMVPWGRPGNGNDGNLEAGYGKSDMDNAAFAALNLGSREDLAHIQTWSPRGDRDVGEPKRAMSYLKEPYHDGYVSSARDNYLDASYSYGKPAAIPTSIHPPFRHLPSHLVADSAISQAQCRGTLYEKKEAHPTHSSYPYSPNLCSPEPRDQYPSPRGTCLDMPWDQNLQPHPPRSMTERLRNLGKPTAEPPERDPGRLPTPDAPPVGKEELEQWGYSFKTSLVNAFNAVAANLGAAGPQVNDDKLSALPSRRSTRKSIRHILRSEGESNKKAISRSGSILTSASKPWTLEEIAGGAGVVHLHLPELRKSDENAPRPPMGGQTLSFGDGENISILGDLQGNEDNVKTGQAQVPLVASSKPLRALVRPDGYFSGQKSTEKGSGNTLSRRSSIYSTASARSSAPTQGAPELSRIPSVKSKTRRKTNSEEDSVVIQPDAISRRPSSDSSFILRR